MVTPGDRLILLGRDGTATCCLTCRSSTWKSVITTTTTTTASLLSASIRTTVTCSLLRGWAHTASRRPPQSAAPSWSSSSTTNSKRSTWQICTLTASSIIFRYKNKKRYEDNILQMLRLSTNTYYCANICIAYKLGSICLLKQCLFKPLTCRFVCAVVINLWLMTCHWYLSNWEGPNACVLFGEPILVIHYQSLLSVGTWQMRITSFTVFNTFCVQT